MRVAGSLIPVLATEPLIAMKLKAGGGQDIVDVERLLALLVPAGHLNMGLLKELAGRLRVDPKLAKILNLLGLQSIVPLDVVFLATFLRLRRLDSIRARMTNDEARMTN